MRIPPLQEWRQDQAEQGEDQTLQGNEDIREKRRHHQGDEDEEAVAFEAGQPIVPRRRQETHEDPRAVERRQGNHVEDGKVDVVQDDEMQDHRQGRRRKEMELDKDDFNDQGDESRDQVGHGTSQGYTNFPFPPVPEIADLDRNRLGPAELGDEQHDQADRVDMSHRVQRKAPHQTRRIIAHPVCHLGMGVFMDDHGDEQAGNPGNNRKYIKIEHRILLSLIFLLYGIQEKITRCG